MEILCRFSLKGYSFAGFLMRNLNFSVKFKFIETQMKMAATLNVNCLN